MYSEFDMTTGEWLSGDHETGQGKMEAPAEQLQLGLQPVESAVHQTPTMPMDLMGIPVDDFLLGQG